jgi:hypothetical protein
VGGVVVMAQLAGLCLDSGQQLPVTPTH